MECRPYVHILVWYIPGPKRSSYVPTLGSMYVSTLVLGLVGIAMQDATMLTVAYSNDGVYFSSDVVVVNTWVRDSTARYRLGFGFLATSILSWRLLCSFLVMACFLSRDYNLLPQKELHRSLQVERRSQLLQLVATWTSFFAGRQVEAEWMRQLRV